MVGLLQETLDSSSHLSLPLTSTCGQIFVAQGKKYTASVYFSGCFQVINSPAHFHEWEKGRK